MATKVKNNLGAVRTLNTLNKNARAAQKNLRKVSTGERITSAEDDASAYGISERMREKIRSLDQANENTQNDLAMMRTAEGAVANIVETLKTLKAKAIDSANDSNTDEDRRIMQKEVDQLLDQIDDNALVTFNGKFLVNGNMSGSVRTRTVLVCEGISNSEETSPTDQGILFNPMTKLTHAALYPNIGESLGIEETDIIKISHVINGETLTRTETIGQKPLGTFLIGYKDTFPSGSSYDYGKDIVLAEYVTWAFSSGAPENHPNTMATGMINLGSTAYPLDSAGTIQMIEPTMSNEISVLVDSSNAPLRVQNTKHQAIALVSNTDFRNPDPDTGVAEIKHGLSAVSIIIMDASGKIKQDATNALKFSFVQLGKKTADSSAGGDTGAATFHVGAGANQSMTMSLSDMRAYALGLKSKDGTQTLSIKTRDDALAAIDAFDNAIEAALDQLTSIGAIEARLEYTAANITTSTENVQAADSTNRDADMAKEMTNYTKDNILLQAAQAMLAQANQDASAVLQLLS